MRLFTINHHHYTCHGKCAVEAIDRSMVRREHMISELKQRLEKAQVRMKQQADKHSSDRCFQVGDWIWLKLQPYRQFSLQHRGNQKLANNYYGPFQVVEVVGKVAYKVQLPEDAKIHNVSPMKQYYGEAPVTINVPMWFKTAPTGTDLVSASIIDRRVIVVLRGNIQLCKGL